MKNIEFRHPVRPGKYVDCCGRTSAVLGIEEGIFEIWAWPLKICSDFQLFFKTADMAAPAALAGYANEIVIRPWEVNITCCTDRFTVKLTAFVPPDTPVPVFIVQKDSAVPVDIYTGFIPLLKPMWPHGIGGHYVIWDDHASAYIISEGRKEFNGIITSPGARQLKASPAHEISANFVYLKLDPSRNSVPVAISGIIGPREKMLDAVSQVLIDPDTPYKRAKQHYIDLFAGHTKIETPEPYIDKAFEWAKISFDRCIVKNPQLGTGIVAGIGSSGSTERPGFGWFFGGDTLINSPAVIGYGDFDNLKRAYRLLISFQREDGKIPHEISQSAGMIPWFKEYPYAFIHADTTPCFIISVMEYIRATDDREFLSECWGAVKKAHQFCVSNDSDGDGIAENESAGLGASELGSLRDELFVDAFLASLCTEAHRAMVYLARVIDDEPARKRAEEAFTHAGEALHEKFYNKKTGLIVYGLKKDGSQREEVTAWQTMPLFFHLFSDETAAGSLRSLASYALSTDWGVRMLSRESGDYDPVAYNNGAVWLFLTGLVSLSEYRYHRHFSGYDHYVRLVQQMYFDARGLSTELMSGDFHLPVSTSVQHQLFSSAPIIYVFLRGILGMEPDMPARTLKLTPHFPYQWEEMNVSQIRFPGGNFALKYERKQKNAVFSLKNMTGGTLELTLSPGFAPFTRCTGVLIDGEPVEYSEETSRTDIHFTVSCGLSAEAEIEFQLQYGFEMLYDVVFPFEGSRTSHLKIIDSELNGNTCSVTAEGRQGRTFLIPFNRNGGRYSFEGAETYPGNDDREYLKICFENSENESVTKTVFIRQKQG